MHVCTCMYVCICGEGHAGMMLLEARSFGAWRFGTLGRKPLHVHPAPIESSQTSLSIDPPRASNRRVGACGGGQTRGGVGVSRPVLGLDDPHRGERETGHPRRSVLAALSPPPVAALARTMNASRARVLVALRSPCGVRVGARGRLVCASAGGGRRSDCLWHSSFQTLLLLPCARSRRERAHQTLPPPLTPLPPFTHTAQRRARATGMATGSGSSGGVGT